MPGTDLAQDKDFLALPPSDKHAYLSETDPDFKNLSPGDQVAYVAHVSGTQERAAQPTQFEQERVPNAAPAWQRMGEGAWSGLKAMNPFAGATDTSPEHMKQLRDEALSPWNIAGPLPGMVRGAVSGFQQARQEGQGIIPSIGAAAGGIAGLDVPGIRERAEKGDIAGVIGEGIPAIGATLVAGQSGRLKATPEARISKIGEQFKNVQRPGIKQVDYSARIEKAVPDLQKIAQDNAGKIQTPRDAVDAIESHIEALQTPVSEAAKQMKAAGNVINLEKPIGSAIDSAFEEKTGAYSAKEIEKAKEAIADHIAGEKSPIELENLRKRLNAETSGYYKMSPADKAKSGISDATMTAQKAAANSLRDELYGTDEKPGIFEKGGLQGDIRGLRQRVGNLLEIRDTLQKAITRAEATGDVSFIREALTRNPKGLVGSGGIGAILGFGVGGPWGAMVGGALGEGLNAWKTLRESKNPNLNVRRAFGNLESMGTPNLPAVGFKAPAVPERIPSMVGEQQTLHMQPGSLFQVRPTSSGIPAGMPAVGAQAELFPGLSASQNPFETVQLPPASQPRPGLLKAARERSKKIREKAGD